MNLHLNKELFRDMIDTLNTRTGVAIDIIEKDYYVSAVLKELSKKQDYLKAYFKGGTAVYKILENMNRFSEDIDLTVKVLSEESNTRNKKRLKESALGYKIDGLELIKEECIDNKGSVTGMYKYTSVYADSEMPLQRAGKIQVESTSFTVSEPTEKYYIEPLLYKLASDDEKKILEEKFDISKIEIERTAKFIKINVYTAKPGIIIGKGGAGAESLKAELTKLIGKDININIVEVKAVDTDAQLVAENIAGQLFHSEKL